MVAVEGSKASVSNFTLNRSLGMMEAFVISRLAFLVAVGLASFAGSVVLGRRFVKQPERLRVPSGGCSPLFSP